VFIVDVEMVRERLTEQVVREGDNVYLFLDRKRTYLIKAKKGQKLHTHKGFVTLDDLIGRRFGESVVSSLGTLFYIFKPTIWEYVKKMAHATQIIYPKDAGLIVLYSGVGPGCRIVEAGTGSGALTSVLAHFASPSGRVYSYEIRSEFLETARKNIEKAGVLSNVELKNGDVTTGIEEVDVDAVVLDLATPWLVVPHAYEALKGSGRFVSFSPTIEQVVKTVEALETSGFIDVKTVECFLRGIKVKRGQTRPETLMTGHTGYITHARKALRETLKDN